MKYTLIGKSKINTNFYDFVNDEVLPDTGLDKSDFWQNFISAANDLVPENNDLINERTDIQSKIDKWMIDNKGNFDYNNYLEFLKEIKYIVKEGPDFKIETENVDDEISIIAGPQLVVPIDNARYALNAANARWGSLYDAYYGTDAIKETDGLQKSTKYNPKRGLKVIEKGRDFLDQIFPLEKQKWSDVEKIFVDKENLSFKCQNNSQDKLKNIKQFIGYNGNKENPISIILKNNNLHIEIIIDPKSQVGKNDKAHISDILVESAISTIMDLEDSVAAVDAEDKVKCYRNWLGIMKNELKTTVNKNGNSFDRKLNEDKKFIDINGNEKFLNGRSLLLIRNVGHLMRNNTIILDNGEEIPEGILDAFTTVLCALHDLRIKKNSKKGSIYIVKPKMHGPKEVAFANKTFLKVENVLKLKPNTIKIGIMDEERRTTVNLKECIRNVKKRIVFINTGFLDRTGDEMHTSFEMGAMIFKGEMKKSKWLLAYENWNVDIGLLCGFTGKAQIGKGMWAMPDKMQDMLDQKASHPLAGANCAWVPSPTAATLHSTHYHKINVFERQRELSKRKRANISDILTIPVSDRQNWSKEDINSEIANNAQGILGYVVRWIDQGVGCSKVPDINNIGLMEDRATLRISSQHIANWLHHKIVKKEKVLEILKKMAKVVDQQNANDKNYKPICENFEKSIAFKAACELIFDGKEQICGYTEPILHKRRIEKKKLSKA
ncbi:MAG: malate synthase G [Candidatus Pelagibacter sp.]|nr:malate synthase G [Candidatus Pelagibacter sp.]|tara:strand:+ start:7400 stop:9562 length:2163 start_codon:yes stop_codon:yes gene_type:complete